MKRHPSRTLLRGMIGTGLLALALGAWAQDTASAASLDTRAQAQATADATAEATGEAALDPKASTELDAHHNCLRQTGSRVARSERSGRKCISAHGRVYSREDIQRTGSPDLADALRRLDPSIR